MGSLSLVATRGYDCGSNHGGSQRRPNCNLVPVCVDDWIPWLSRNGLSKFRLVDG